MVAVIETARHLTAIAVRIGPRSALGRIAMPVIEMQVIEMQVIEMPMIEMQVIEMRVIEMPVIARRLIGTVATGTLPSAIRIAKGDVDAFSAVVVADATSFVTV